MIQGLTQQCFDVFGVGEAFLFDLNLEVLEQISRGLHARIRHQQGFFKVLEKRLVNLSATKDLRQVGAGFFKPLSQALDPRHCDWCLSLNLGLVFGRWKVFFLE